jgi:peptidyl-tRNA hydrolase
LSCFNTAERAQLQEYTEKAADALEVLVQKGPQEAMNLYNNRDLLTK